MAADKKGGPQPLARRMAEIAPFHVMELLARARQLEAEGRSIIHMEIGEPDFPTPAPVVAAAQRALAEGKTSYTPSMGLPELRQRIARYYREQHGAQVAAERIIITPGASGALLLALGVVLDRDQQVLLADPGYPCNRHFARFLEGRACPVPVDAAHRFQLSAGLIERHWNDQTVAALVATPSNPTGTLIERNEMGAMADAVRSRGGRLMVDEIYHGLIYEGDAPTALTLRDDIFVINSFSKYFCMTGWRLGWLVVPEEYAREVEKLAQNLYIAAPTLAQHAALVAFEPETMAILEARRNEFRARRDLLLPALHELGFKVPSAPQGAFYIYADASAHTRDSYTFALQLLEQAGVAVTPGIDFGCHEPERYLRFAYTTSQENLREGIERLRRFLG
ncbi:MAG TPA: pyridoxal phosphate-dependent aminotransferase [Gammaproteobacteria bacterium]